MKLIEQSHEILRLSTTPLQDIELAGRTCYKSEDKITADSAPKFVKMLRDRGHHAMLEFGFMTVRFITNRGVTHELVRHRLCSFAQESTRYCNYGGKDMKFIQPVWWEPACIDFKTTSDCLDICCQSDSPTYYECNRNTCNGFLRALKAAAEYYNILLKEGWKPQQAREVLPNALKTEIVVQANLREWRHIFTLRCSPAAHPQMQALMLRLLEEVKERVPVLFDDINEKRKEEKK